MQEEHTDISVISCIRACSLLYSMDMLEALSYDYPLQFFMVMPYLLKTAVTASNTLLLCGLHQ